MNEDEIINTVIEEGQKVLDETYIDVDEDKNYLLLLLAFITTMRFGNVFRRRRSFNLPKSIINKLPTTFTQQLRNDTLILTPAIRKDINKVFGKYKGAKSTIQKLEGENIAKLIRQTRKIQKEILINNIDQIGVAVLARDNGYTKVTAQAKLDNRTRDTHRANSGTTWFIEEKQPWLDYNCRCKYKFIK